jgi:hypothetical protein
MHEERKKFVGAGRQSVWPEKKIKSKNLFLKDNDWGGFKMVHFKDADIVVIGAGTAGAMAAIYAHRTHPILRIVALDKSKMETSVAGIAEWIP